MDTSIMTTGSSPNRSGVIPSPTYSESSLSSSNSPSLCTPDHPNVGLPGRNAKRHADLRAANVRFMAATSDVNNGAKANGDNLDTFGHNGLAAALDFHAAHQQTSGPSPSPLTKKAGHKRNLSAARRHSIQTLMPGEEDNSASPAMVVRRIQQGLTALPLSPTQLAADQFNNDALQLWDGNLDFEALANVPLGDFLLSPPRLTVNLANGALQSTQATNTATTTITGVAPGSLFGAINDDTKRRRTSLTVTDTPQRPLSAQTVMQSTPPNSFTQMQSHAASIQSSVASSRVTQTPISFTTSFSASSIFGSGGSPMTSEADKINAAARPRRRSSISGDCTSEIASLTAGLSVPEIIAPIPVHGVAASKKLTEQALGPNCTTPQPDREGQKPAPTAEAKPAAEALERSDSKSSPNGKGVDVWPDEVEVAFWEALRLIPKLGRRKVLVHGKPCGRNELIADYIERKTGKTRTRKQVSSHIQVLKNIKKGDAEFQQLIAEPQTEEDFYIPAGGMMYAQTLASYGYGGLGGPLFAPDGNANLFSPYSSTMHSPLPPSLHPADGMVTPITPGITAAFNSMHIPSPGLVPHDPKANMSPACPILPASFSMWVHSRETSDKHVYTSLERKSNQMNTLLPRLSLDSVRMGQYRFPRLAEMYHHLPCQFLHVYVPLAVPRADVLLPRYDHLSTQLSLTSQQDTRLTSVTTVYSHGKRVLSLVEPLDAPRQVSGRAASTMANDESLLSVNDPATPANGQKHKYWHQAPFATDFWADFLSRNHPVNVYNSTETSQSFGKEPSERAALGMAVSGVTIVQEFVIANNADQVAAAQHIAADGTMGDMGNCISPGSKVGNVVLVIAWDLECVESLNGETGTPVVSLLTAANASPSPRPSMMLLPSPQTAPMALLTPNRSPAMGGMQQVMAQPLQQASPMMLQPSLSPWQQSVAMSPHSPAVQITEVASHGQQTMPQQQQQQPTLLQKRGMLADGKHNLNISIPSAPLLGVQLGPASATSNGMLSPFAVHQSLSNAPSPTSAMTHSATAWGLMQQRTMNPIGSTPVTPHPQMVGTPQEPPPMGNAADEIARSNRDRLARAWAAAAAAAAAGQPQQHGLGAELDHGNAMGLQLHSPLDVTFGAQANGLKPTAQAMAISASAPAHSSGSAQRLAPPGMFGAGHGFDAASHGGSTCNSAMSSTVSSPMPNHASLAVHNGHAANPLLSPAHFTVSPSLQQGTSAGKAAHAGFFATTPDFHGQFDGQFDNTSANHNMDALSTQEWMDQLLQSVGVSAESK